MTRECWALDESSQGDTSVPTGSSGQSSYGMCGSVGTGKAWSGRINRVLASKRSWGEHGVKYELPHEI